MDNEERVADAIVEVFTSPDLVGSGLQGANIVDVIDRLATCVKAVGTAITPANAAAGQDAMGGHVESLTESIMGVTAGLQQIAEELSHLSSIASAIESLADAVREAGESFGESR